MDASFSSEPNSSHLVSQLLLVSTLLVIPTFLIIFQVFYSKKQHRSSPQSSHHHSTAAVTPAKKKKKKKSISVKAANRQPSASTIAAGNALGNKDGEKCMEEEGDEMISTDENEQKGNNQSSFESESSHCSSSSLSSSDSEESDPTAIDKTDNDKSSDSNDQWIKVKSASNSKGRIDSDVLHNLQKQIKDLCLENERKQEAIHKLQSQLAICKSAAKNQALQMASKIASLMRQNEEIQRKPPQSQPKDGELQSSLLTTTLDLTESIEEKVAINECSTVSEPLPLLEAFAEFDEHSAFI